jgi:hypothetical protein
MADGKESLPVEPPDGAIVLTCAHNLARQKHAFHAPDGIVYRTKSGEEKVATWLVACTDCVKKAGGNPQNIKWASDGQWQSKAAIEARFKTRVTGPDN